MTTKNCNCCEKQSKEKSFLEAALNALSSLITANITWIWIIMAWVHMLNINANNFTLLQMTIVNSVFTVVSMIRSYFWRRVFNKLS